MKIPVYITRPLVINWLSSNEPNLKHFLDFILFKNLESFHHYLKKSIINSGNDNSNMQVIVAVDISNLHAEIIQSIRDVYPVAKIILFDLIEDNEVLLEYLRYGYNSIIEVGTKPHEVIAIIQKLTKQEISVGTDLIDRLLAEKFYNKFCTEKNGSANNSENKKIIKNILTEKQQLVFECLLMGHTYKEIAHSLGISFYSVNQRAKTIYKKVGVKSRIELMNLVH